MSPNTSNRSSDRSREKKAKPNSADTKTPVTLARDGEQRTTSNANRQDQQSKELSHTDYLLILSLSGANHFASTTSSTWSDIYTQSART